METKSLALGFAGSLLLGGMAFGLVATANADSQPAPAPAVITSTTATPSPEPTTAPEPVVTPEPEPTIDSVAGQVVEQPAPAVEAAPVAPDPAPVAPAPVAPAPVAPAPVAPAPAPAPEPVQTGATYQLLPPGTVVSSPEEGAVINGPAMSTGNGKR